MPMPKLLLATLALCWPAATFAGTFTYTPAAITPNQMTCVKESRVDGVTPKAPMDVMCCDASDVFWLEASVPTNAAGGGWACTIDWVMDTADTTTGCMTITNTVCKAGQSCQDLTPANAALATLVGGGTADVLVRDTFATFVLRDVGGAADCSAGSCKGDVLLMKHTMGTAGACTQNLTADRVCWKQIVCDYTEG